ncbi:TetR/AcrR family transcriptional regulator [Oceanicella sp. SM1341]|uniref:TetR/AcrR family transcriptional regulator n=1 Tax=Oceanicella sp. SM1341 TaxID=1548889 RepID=UPI0018E4F4E2|nr:TetR/AcrR family transcriptional regulator [Oceanicella sp. SM1341]
MATQRAILRTAYRMMAGEGLAATSIEAVARRGRVSKMTIYKWWPSREELLIDAFLGEAAELLELPGEGAPLATLESHAARYAEALAGEFGRVQLAVVADCVARRGSAELFSERYLGPRRAAISAVIAAGQAAGEVTAQRPAEELYDQIYGTLFYQHAFGFRRPEPERARTLVRAVLCPGEAKGK